MATLAVSRPDDDVLIGRRSAPFLKWAGGKRQLLPELLKEAPRTISTYYEPFVGGGALFFALAARGRFRRAVLADCNQDLIDCYQAIKSDVKGVISALGGLAVGPDEFYELRAQNPTELDPSRRAARTIYLNKVGFNGLYRVNSRGQFNVPYGRHNNPLVCDVPRLQAAAAALKNVKLCCQDFAKTVATAKPADFVYFDPPYVPVSATAYFTAYARSPFGPSEQGRLAQVLRQLRERKVPALLSNSDCAATRGLYDGLEMRSVDVRRAINSVATRRGSVKEILVKSFSF
ncbi:MAG TPA: DNA adenine methylase [Polyangia bacterium]|nr:DNA adenine methylase [Polyangia bacterium]